MAFGDDDLAIFFDDFGVDVIVDGVTAKGILDPVDGSDTSATLGGGINVVRRDTMVTVPTGAFPGLRRNAAVTVDGDPMVVRGEPMQGTDGSLTVFHAVRP